jgi:hypothetical protein
MNSGEKSFTSVTLTFTIVVGDLHASLPPLPTSLPLLRRLLLAESVPELEGEEEAGGLALTRALTSSLYVSRRSRFNTFVLPVLVRINRNTKSPTVLSSALKNLSGSPPTILYLVTQETKTHVQFFRVSFIISSKTQDFDDMIMCCINCSMFWTGFRAHNF